METDQPAPENPEQASSDEQGTSPARSYECTFCKRGFSNAQALGGHMNIHRRDKAKLKQASSLGETTQQSFDIVSKIIPPSYTPNHPRCTTVLQPIADASQEIIRSSPGKWTWINQEEDDANKRDKTHVGEIKQLPLFDEKPSISDQVEEGTGKDMSKSQAPSGWDQLDLELRLGPEPSSPPMATKKFF